MDKRMQHMVFKCDICGGPVPGFQRSSAIVPGLEVTHEMIANTSDFNLVYVNAATGQTISEDYVLCRKCSLKVADAVFIDNELTLPGAILAVQAERILEGEG